MAKFMKMSRARAAAGNNPSASAVVFQLEDLEERQIKIAEARDQHLIALVNAQLETNRLLAEILVRLGGDPRPQVR